MEKVLGAKPLLYRTYTTLDTFVSIDKPKMKKGKRCLINRRNLLQPCLGYVLLCILSYTRQSWRIIIINAKVDMIKGVAHVLLQRSSPSCICMAAPLLVAVANKYCHYSESLCLEKGCRKYLAALCSFPLDSCFHCNDHFTTLSIL